MHKIDTEVFMLIDTHCHLDFVMRAQQQLFLTPDDLVTISAAIEKASQAGVTKIINVGCDVVSSSNSLYLSEHFPNVFATVGLHPTDSNHGSKNEIGEFRKLIKQFPRAKLVAIGEIGIDYYHQPFNAQNQKDSFVAQIELALELGLPISIHTRGEAAGDDVLRIIEPYIKNNLSGVIHCFQQSRDFAKTATGWGFVLGIDGPIDYPKNAELRQIVKEVGLDKLVLETDAPFLPPQRYRGKKNEPSYLLHVAEALAELFEVSVEAVASVTSGNASRIFKL